MNVKEEPEVDDPLDIEEMKFEPEELNPSMEENQETSRDSQIVENFHKHLHEINRPKHKIHHGHVVKIWLPMYVSWDQTENVCAIQMFSM